MVNITKQLSQNMVIDRTLVKSNFNIMINNHILLLLFEPLYVPFDGEYNQTTISKYGY